MLLRASLAILFCFIVVTEVLSQSGPGRRQSPRTSTAKAQPKTRPTQPTTPAPTPELTAEPSSIEDQQEAETLKTDTNVVTVPVIASTAEGNYLPDLQREEFTVDEDGEKQEIAFFATVSAPFNVVLLLDTSGSTEEKISLIREAAIAFVGQLQSADRVAVISFDDEVRVLSEFTSDRTALRASVNKAAPGQGTKLYDAVEIALASIKTIKGRKAIVLFSDGVDYRSDRASFDGTLRGLEEEGVVVYPIRYETRAETARLMREQMEQQGPQLPTRDVINSPPRGTTAPTFPSNDPETVPTSGQGRQTGPLGLPSAAEILRRRREEERNRDRDRYPDRYPTPGGQPPIDRSDPRDPRDRPIDPGSTSRRPRGEDENTTSILDQLYLTADSYLLELANKSGGRILRADTLRSLPDAFGKIAAELRTQYAIGYYPSNKTRDGKYRKIKVGTTRKNVAIRARPGYRAPLGG